MKYNKLGATGMNVSAICLGTMTYGQQNSEKEAHEQLDYALEHGVNFIDTAEMYSVPSSEATFGLTEQFIGSWIDKKENRDQFYLATKVTGPSPNLSYISPNLGFSRERIFDALTKSLKRLKTDYIDLYQLHWPERNTNFFGELGYKHDEEERWKDNFAEAIDTLGVLVKQGKIRHWGLSNETPWGVMRTNQVAENFGHPKVATIQNPYSLLNRTYEVGLAEISMRENCPLLPYSPLGFGRLTNKYHNGTDTPESRLNKYSGMERYNSKQSLEASKLYYELAKKYDMSLATMSLGFLHAQPFVGSVIIGATNLDQLKENIEAGSMELSKEISEEINNIHQQIPNPAP